MSDDPRRRARAALEPVAVHPGAAADRALGDRPRGRRVERRHRDLRRDVTAVDVVQVAVPRLGDHRQQPGGTEHRDDAPRPIAPSRCGRRPRECVLVMSDRHRERPALLDPGGAGHLAVAVERVPPGGTGLPEAGVTAGHDRGDAGAHRPLADHQWSVAVDERRHADRETGHVGDRVQRTGRAGERDAEARGLARSRS